MPGPKATNNADLSLMAEVELFRGLLVTFAFHFVQTFDIVISALEKGFGTI
jgi:hypothetical protein